MNVILILSGGMDSTTLLYDLLKEGHKVHAITFDYNQRHRREIDHAQQNADRLGICHYIADLSASCGIFLGSSQTTKGIAVPHGHYADENMKKTVVPNRNMTMISMAVAYAISLTFDTVAYAAHAGDHTVYPDCRPEFVEAMRVAIALCDWQDVKLHVPYLEMTKAQICERGSKLQVPFGATYSCYEGEQIHCGKCGTCVERKEAFETSGVADPTLYRDVIETRKVHHGH